MNKTEKINRLIELLWWLKGFASAKGFNFLIIDHIKIIEDIIFELREDNKKI